MSTVTFAMKIELREVRARLDNVGMPVAQCNSARAAGRSPPGQEKPLQQLTNISERQDNPGPHARDHRSAHAGGASTRRHTRARRVRTCWRLMHSDQRDARSARGRCLIRSQHGH